MRTSYIKYAEARELSNEGLAYFEELIDNTYAGKKVLVVYNNQNDHPFRKLDKLIEHLGKPEKRLNRLTFKNGMEITCITYSSNLRGYHPDMIILLNSHFKKLTHSLAMLSKQNTVVRYLKW